DFNIAPADPDCYDAEKWKGQVLCTDAERSRFQALLSLGLSDGFRRLRPSQRQFTWWDYRGNQFGSNQGLRIDHHLISEALWPRVLDISVDEEARGRTEASDHAAVTLHLQDVAAVEGRLPSPPTPGKQVGLFG
ncbi:MAG TPA: hypothetical protein PLA94_23845, partial [Myxococcota bacterium]|nr:hypothetical protein [Myxococcota bacterium]